MSSSVFTRQWAMHSADTFSIRPIERLLHRWLKDRRSIVDPFARNSRLAHWRNDLNPETQAEHHMDAREFLKTLYDADNFEADALLLDPPYSPRQISEVYQSIGRKCSTEDTQNARLYREVRDLGNRLLVAGGIVISFGWNSAGMGTPAYRMEEVLLVPHGGAHNDTIVVVETKIQAGLFFGVVPDQDLNHV